MATITKRKDRKGKVTYFARIRRKGAKPLCASFQRKTDAKTWILETEREVLSGRYFDRREERKHTLKEAIDRYVRDYETDYLRKGHLKRWVKEIGYLLLSDVTHIVISDVIAKWKSVPNERGELRGPASLNRYLSSLSVVLTAAHHDWGWVSRNAARDVRRQSEPRGRMRFLSDDERERLLRACESSYCPYIYPIVVLALSTGMRKSEILGLRWSNIDLEKGILLLHNTKNKDPRRVAIRGLALELLRKHAKVRRLNTDLLFPGDKSSENGRPFDIRKAWNDARIRAKIEDFVFHDLRHSCASYLAMNGATMLEIAEVLGHRTLQMVKRYTHLADSHTAGVVERMNEKIFG